MGASKKISRLAIFYGPLINYAVIRPLVIVVDVAVVVAVLALVSTASV